MALCVNSLVHQNKLRTDVDLGIVTVVKRVYPFSLDIGPHTDLDSGTTTRLLILDVCGGGG